MANPLTNEKELYAEIEKNKLSIPPAIWQLIEHHLGNDVYTISLIIGSHAAGDEKKPIPADDGEKVIKHCLEIRAFLKKLKEAIEHKNVREERK